VNDANFFGFILFLDLFDLFSYIIQIKRNDLAEKEYVILSGECARKRHFLKTEKGKIIYFVVQLEIEFENEWKPVVRYDCAHGFSHIDRYDKKGKKRKELLDLPFDEALTLADEDINTNWEDYKIKFLRGG